MKYDVNTEIYEGPLHLLVELAKMHLLDIFLIKLQGLTAQYLDMVRTGAADLNQLAEPLPLLGQLVALKARLLLPQPQVDEEEEVPISLEELERRLREYEQFKTVAQVLAELHALQHEYFSRSQPVRVTAEPADGEPPAPLAPVEVGIVDLMTAFARVLDKAQAPMYELQAEPWTVEMKVEELSVQLSVKRQLTFLDVFSPEKSRLELVVTFLALLELVRRRICLAVQERPFAEIVIVRRDDGHPALPR